MSPIPMNKPMSPTPKPVAPTPPVSTPLAAPIPMLRVVAPAPPTPPAPATPITPVIPMLRAPQTPAPVIAPRETPVTRPLAAVATMPVSLAALAESWPDNLRQEIAHFSLTEARVALPVESIATALKRGRVMFPWKLLRGWIQPTHPAASSPNDETELELPLSVIAPLFLARNRSQASGKSLAIDEGIPNLFFGFPKADAPAPAAPMLSADAKMAASTDTNYYVFDDCSEASRLERADAVKKGKQPSGTEFVAKYATPNEIVSRAASLDGVAGALIALPDGLMVASRVPAELNGDTLAAFLPQIFSKVSMCTKELRMGDLNNLNFTVGNVPWKIFRVNAIFFAAFGRAAEAMPSAQLAALAAELDRKHK
jgi:predicted regulator of Ras-like GTPase activity (Roadblock/LC7/MglB family)